MKRVLILHPFLFAVFPVLFLFAYNIDEVRGSDLLLPVLVVTALALIILFLFKLVTRSYSRSGIITTCFLVLFYSYGYIRDWVSSLRIESPLDFSGPLFLGPVWALLFIGAAFLVMRARRSFRTLTLFLNIVGISLAVISLVNVGTYAVKAINLEQDEISPEDSSIVLKDADNLPDIYYIILDAYGRADTLEETYDFDNSEFIDFLTDRGFYVASRSRSNYSGTILSVPSSLNMEYPDCLADMSVDEMDTSVLYKMLINSRVSQILKSAGYRYILVSSGWEIKDMNKYADVYSYAYELAYGALRINISSFTNHVVRSTALEPLIGRFVSAEGSNAILYAFDTLADIPDINGPKFVFTHVCSPHPPWHFDRNGDPALPSGPQPSPDIHKETYPISIHWYDKERYIDQVVFVNRKVMAIIDEILSKSEVPPIIILQGDHGPESYPYGTGVSVEEGFRRQQHERMAILNAYFFPERNDSALYQSITPVNSFRVVFNLYFGTNYDLLEDESYFLTFDNPRKLITVPPESGDR